MLVSFAGEDYIRNCWRSLIITLISYVNTNVVKISKISINIIKDCCEFKAHYSIKNSYHLEQKRKNLIRFLTPKKLLNNKKIYSKGHEKIPAL